MASRATSAQIIAQGNYLEPDFDPSTLTVAQLLGIFGFHNIDYPTTYTKPKLIQLFNDEIKPKAKKFSKERLTKQNSLASDDGITDGRTGKPLNERTSSVPVRRSSRRSSRPPQDFVTGMAPEPPKRRRSSAEPTLGGPSRKKSIKPNVPVLEEESESEDAVVRKVSRNKKSTADAGSQSRLLAQDDHDSGWEDNNIFQSGAESSSPSRPSPLRSRPRRPSMVTSRSRKSLSAPPEYALSPTKGKGKAEPLVLRVPSVRPPESSFEPDLPLEVIRESKLALSSVASSVALALPHATFTALGEDVNIQKSHELQDYQEGSLLGVDPAQDGIASEDSSNLEESLNPSLDQAQLPRQAPGGGVSSWANSLFSARSIVACLLVAGAFYLVSSFASESASIGFCDTGSATNDILESLRARRVAIEHCNRENNTYLFTPNMAGTESSKSPPAAFPSPSDTWSFKDEGNNGRELCPAPPPLPLPCPNVCTPCPPHSVCSPMTMSCETGYLIRPHPLLFFFPLPLVSRANSNPPNSYTVPAYSSLDTRSTFELMYKGLSKVLDGLPGLGPVAFPPRCIEDPKRRERIGALGHAIESQLGSHRGVMLCNGEVSSRPGLPEAEEAMIWGMELDKLKAKIKSNKMKKLPTHVQEAFEDNFNEAIQQLLQWGGVLMSEDASGKRFLASRSPHMGWGCTAKVKLRQMWKEWRAQVAGTMFIIIALVILRRRQALNAAEARRVASLVQTVLESLRNQELAYLTDPVISSHPFLSSLQLRDLILQDEHSVGARRRLWKRVGQIVESNANVRTNLEEMEGGDEMRVWRWVGSTGKTLPSSNQ